MELYRATAGRRSGAFVVAAVARAARIACLTCDGRPERDDDVAQSALAAAVALREALPGPALPLAGRGRAELEGVERRIVALANVLHGRCWESLA